MQEDTMVCWAVLMVLLSCRGVSSSSSSSSSGDTEGQSDNCTTNTNHLKVVCVAAGHSVTVSCPDVSGDMVIFSLLAGQVEMETYSKGSNATTKPDHRGMGVTVEVNPEGGRGGISYVLSRVSAENAGFYSCEAKVWEPPPVKKTCGRRVFVHMEEHQCSCQAEQSVNGSHGCENAAVPDWMWVMGTAVLGTYSLTVTIIAMVIWGRLRQLDSNHSDYMNTKPRRPPGGHKSPHKNTRVQTPSRHFC